jgi:DNA-binding Lrp family transcriptional regulator
LKKIKNKLDLKDYAILRALDNDVRASNAQIGRITRLSKETVQYRIGILEKNKIITGYWTVPTIGTNFHLYKILLKNKSLGKEKKKEFIEYMKKEKLSSWFASTQGNWDYVVSSFAENDEDFSKFMVDFLEKFGSYFRDKQIIKGIEVVSMNEKYLYSDGKLLYAQKDNLLISIPKKDDVDKEILRALSINARVSFSDIARNLNLSSEAVSKRFKALEKNNLIKAMKVRIDHSKLGLEYYHLFVSMNNYLKKDAVCAYFITHPCCVFLMKHLGAYDLHVELVMKPDFVDSIIDELSEKFGEDISSYELLKIQKEYIMVVLR